jgi:hypothetical protein
MKLGAEATGKITKLENENAQLKKDLATKPAPTTGTGTQTDPQAIAGTEEWKAVALFLTEPNYYKARKLFNDLYGNK